MFTKSEHRQLSDKYFVVLTFSENIYEIQSKNTKHCWFIEQRKNGKVHTLFTPL